MSFFQGLTFLRSAHIPRYSWWIDRRFDGDWGIQYNHAGSMQWAMGRQPLRVCHGPLAWITYPGPQFRYGNRLGGNWDHYYVTFTGPRAERYVRSGLLPVNRRPALIPIREPERFRDAFLELLDCLHADPPLAVHRLEGLLLLLGRQPQQSARNEAPLRRALRELAERIRRTPGQPIDFTAEARHLHVSPDHFRRSFRLHTGLAPHQFLLRARLDHAAGQLRFTDEPIKEIAAQTGIPDIYYFTRLFRQTYHLPPGRYRQEFQTLQGELTER